MIYLVILPLFWITTLITVVILAYKNRKEWFEKGMKTSTIILLLLCTPLSIWGISSLTRPEIEWSSTAYHPKNGVTIKSETWNYRSGQTAIIKFWKLDTESGISSNEKDYKKDSLWVYFDKNGDTLKIEKYKNDQLIEKIEGKK